MTFLVCHTGVVFSIIYLTYAWLTRYLKVCALAEVRTMIYEQKNMEQAEIDIPSNKFTSTV
jgi:hypothetical protein